MVQPEAGVRNVRNSGAKEAANLALNSLSLPQKKKLWDGKKGVVGWFPWQHTGKGDRDLSQGRKSEPLPSSAKVS